MPLFLFIYHIFLLYNIHTIIESHSYNTFAEASLHLLIAWQLSGTDLPVVPSREEPRVKLGPAFQQADALYQLSHAAPLWHAAPF